MAIIGVLSGKGGVGKTTISINLASLLTNHGTRTVVVDSDLYTPNISLSLGVVNAPHYSNDVFNSLTSLNQTICKHISGIEFIPSMLNAEVNLDSFNNLSKKILTLKQSNDLTFVDMPSGLGPHITSLVDSCDYCIIVTSPDLLGVTNAMKAINLVTSLNKQVLGVIVNKCEGVSCELSNEEITSLTQTKILARIPYSKDFSKSLFMKTPFVCAFPSSEIFDIFKSVAFTILS